MGAPAPAGKSPHSSVRPAGAGGTRGRRRSRGGLPSAPPGEGGSCPDLKTGSGEVLGHLHPLPELSSSGPARFHCPGSFLGPHPSQTPLGSPQSCCLGTIPDLPLLGGPHPTPPAPFWDGTRARQPGCVWGRKRRVWEEERKGPSPPTAGRAGSWKTLFGFFLSKLSLFPTPFFRFFQEPPQQNPRVSLVSLRCFPLAPGRLSSADSPFSRLLLLLLIPTLAVIKKKSTFPPRGGSNCPPRAVSLCP